MVALYSEHVSCSGDTHNFIIAAFTTQEKAEVVLAKFKEHFPKDHFVVLEYHPPKIDPEFEEIIWEGVETDL
jgi:hypothetical protein